MKKTSIKHKGQDVDVYVFDTRFYEVDGERWEITGSRSTGGGLMDAEHRVKNGKESKIISHDELIKLFNSGNLRTLKK